MLSLAERRSKDHIPIFNPFHSPFCFFLDLVATGPLGLGSAESGDMSSRDTVHRKRNEPWRAAGGEPEPRAEGLGLDGPSDAK